MTTTMLRIEQTMVAPEEGTNESLWERARESLAGGANSTMRVLPYHLPLVAQRGRGSRIWDVQGRVYIDLNMAYGPLIFGHCPGRVVEAVTEQVRLRGSQLGFPFELAVRVAEKVKVLYPHIELLRFSNSGTEAVATAIRLARAVTGRKTVVLFEGHYHGWSDPVFHRYHAALEELPEGDFGPALPGTLGMNGSPDAAIVVRWNNLEALRRCLELHGRSTAAIVMEPVMCNAGVVPPRPGYLQGVRRLADQYGLLLIFDEVITGLRVAAGGAQELYSVAPDITILSKALGGGYPVACLGGCRSLMEPVANGSLFHGGVYSGNATVMAAAEAVLDTVIAERETMYTHLFEIGAALADGLREIMARHEVPHVVQGVGPVLSLFLTSGPVDRLAEYRDVRRHCDFQKYIRFQHQMQRSGVYCHPNQFEPMFLSTAHSDGDVAQVLERIEDGVRCCLVP